MGLCNSGRPNLTLHLRMTVLFLFLVGFAYVDFMFNVPYYLLCFARDVHIWIVVCLMKHLVCFD